MEIMTANGENNNDMDNNNGRGTEKTGGGEQKRWEVGREGGTTMMEDQAALPL